MSEVLPSLEKMFLSGGALTNGFISQVMELSGVSNPGVVLDATPIATETGHQTIIKVRDHFSNAGANVSIIDEHTPAQEAMEQLYDSTDILFVTGGDTKKLLDDWREKHRDDHVTTLLHAGKLTVCGASAGSLIWFDRAYSDYKQYHSNGRPWDYFPLNGLGLLPGWGNVHHTDRDSSGRRRNHYFETSRQTKSNDPAIGLDTFAALRIQDGEIAPVDLRTKDTRTDATGSVYYYADRLLKNRRILTPDQRINLQDLRLVTDE